MRTRLHRALSWLGRAEQEKDDDDARFLFLWVAFNAAYAGQFNDEGKELAKARLFIDRLLGRTASSGSTPCCSSVSAGRYAR